MDDLGFFNQLFREVDILGRIFRRLGLAEDVKAEELDDETPKSKRRARHTRDWEIRILRPSRRFPFFGIRLPEGFFPKEWLIAQGSFEFSKRHLEWWIKDKLGIPSPEELELYAQSIGAADD